MCAHQGQDNQEERERDPAHCWRLRRLPFFYEAEGSLCLWDPPLGKKDSRSFSLPSFPPAHPLSPPYCKSLRGKLKRRRKKTVSLRLSSTYDAHVLSLLERMFSIRFLVKEKKKPTGDQKHTEMTDVRETRGMCLLISTWETDRESKHTFNIMAVFFLGIGSSSGLLIRRRPRKRKSLHSFD